MLKCLKDIQSGKSTLVPVYDFKSNARVDGEFVTIQPSDVVLLEGILVFYYKEVREVFDMKLFVDTDADTRLARRGKQSSTSSNSGNHEKSNGFSSILSSTRY